MIQLNHRSAIVAGAAVASIAWASVAAGYGGSVSVNRSGSYSRSATVHDAGASVHTNVNRNVNANVNRNVNVNRGGSYNRGGYYNRGGSYNRGGYYGGYDRWGHPLAAVGVAATALAVGTVVSALPSTGCAATQVGNVVYQQCGPTYYQPVYQGGAVTYVVVNPPQ